jgi:hypothetical protein
MRRVFLFFAIVFVVWTVCAYAAPVGRITHVEGRVDVLKVGKNMAAPITLGTPVDVGDVYRAKSGSRAEITFTNRNLLRIASSSRVEIKEYMVQGDKSSNIVRLHRGKVQAVSADDLVRKVAAFAEGNRFEVHTQNAVAGIRGTNMLVGFEKGATIVIFLAGQGYLYNPNRPDVITPISAGNMSVVASPGGAPSAPRTTPPGQQQGFIQGVTFASGGGPAGGTQQPGNVGASGGAAFESGGDTAGGGGATPGLVGTGVSGADVGSLTSTLGSTGTTLLGTTFQTPVVPATFYVPPEVPTSASSVLATFNIPTISGVFYGKVTDAGVLGATPITMTLTWGATPSDLDSRLWVPPSGANPQTLVNYYNMGSSTSYPYAYLDQDVTWGHGPETITIVTNVGGRYYYSVNNFSGYWDGDTPLSSSQAHLVVRDNAGHTYTFDVPKFGSGYYWNVFYWENNELYVSNTIGDESLVGRTIIPVGQYTANLSGTGYLWSGSATPITASGAYSVLSPTNRYTMNNFIPLTLPSGGGALQGVMGGMIGRGVAGAMYALYIDPAGKAGILQGSFAGSTDSQAGTWTALGSLQAIPMSNTLGILPQNLGTSITSLNFSTTAADTAILNGLSLAGAYTYELAHEKISTADFGVWKTYLDGTFASMPPSTWTGSFDHFDSTTKVAIGQEIAGTLWSDQAINGRAAGYGADGTAGTTWVAVGDVIGTYDTSNGFAITSLGTSIETSAFLQMLSTADGLAKLQQLNFPCAEVGKVTLTGTAPYNVTMTDVKFLSYQGAQAPAMWATGDVTGSNVSTPVGQTVALSGGYLSANFNMKVWDTVHNTWLATVTNGTGNLSGGAQPYSGYINFRGAGAGQILTSSTFKGTASGVAKAASAP